MATFKLTLSSKTNGNGESEILSKCRVSHSLEMRLKTGIFVAREIFVEETGEIYTEKKHLQREATKANSRLNAFKASVENIIKETEKAAQRGRFTGRTGKDWKEWTERVLSLQGIDLKEASYNEMNDAITLAERTLAEQQKAAEAAREEAEARAKAEEEERNRKTIFQHIDAYCERKQLSEKRCQSFRSLKRYLLTFQYYIQMIEGERSFVVDYATMTTEVIDKFHKFLLEEATKRKEASKKKRFEKIDQLVNNAFPLKGTARLKEEGRSENYITDILKKLGSVFNMLSGDGLVSSNPVDKAHKELQIYGTPIYLTKEQRNKIASFDLSGHRRELAINRDIFIFQCLTGMRFGDLCELKPSDIVNGVLCYTANKTKKSSGKVVKVPLNQTALALVEKYKGHHEKCGKKDGLFPFRSLNSYNSTIKRVLEYCGITQEVTEYRDPLTGKNVKKRICDIAASHLARRTFIGILYKEVKDPNLIGSMSGHIYGSKAFARYHKIDEEDQREVISFLD